MTVITFPQKENEETELSCEGTFVCHNCKHEWEASSLIPAIELECPNCARHLGSPKYPLVPDFKHEVYQCGCGCTMFTIFLLDNTPCKCCASCGAQEELIVVYP